MATDPVVALDFALDAAVLMFADDQVQDLSMPELDRRFEQVAAEFGVHPDALATAVIRRLAGN